VKGQKRTVGITQAARILDVHPNTLRKWADEGLVPHIRLPSGYRRFDIVELEQFRISLQRSRGRDAAT
jgi:DNA-binding transcriptional MerR regulator